jgi:hypothetical protein
MPGEEIVIAKPFQDYKGLFLYHCHNCSTFSKSSTRFIENDLPFNWGRIGFIEIPIGMGLFLLSTSRSVDSFTWAAVSSAIQRD